jgi:hypothetical protein
VDKRLIYPQYNANGNRDVFSITEDRRWLKKESSAGKYHPEIQKYIDNAKPIKNLIQVLLTALGAHEYWGQNVNGDRFYEGALKHDGADYGHKTFKTNANYFTHHVNKDPALSKGEVLEAVWNDKAKRVELVVGINPTLDPDAASMLDNGEELCFSMGARLPYDVCTVCGNKARTRAEYCDHLRYQMNQIDPKSGVLVGAVNPFPKFFDISRVLIPADKTAYMWEKIAHATNNPLAKVGSAEIAERGVLYSIDGKQITKTASVHKSAEITKQIPATSTPVAVEKLKKALHQVKCALDKTASEIPVSVFKDAGSLNQCIVSMSVLGISPTVGEMNKLSEAFKLSDSITEYNIANYINPKVINSLSEYVNDRSFYRPALIDRLSSLDKEASIVGDSAKFSVETGKAITSGVLSAIGSIFGITGSMAPKAKNAVDAMPSGLASQIAQHPLLAGVLAAIIVKSLSSPSQVVTDGNFSVAEQPRGMYNNDWQRRFVEMQNRPVAVIKTGAAEKLSYLVSPLTYLLMSVDLQKTAEEQRLWNNTADQFLKYLQSENLKTIVKSAAKIAPSEFDSMADSVPELADIKMMKLIMEFSKEGGCP